MRRCARRARAAPRRRRHAAACGIAPRALERSSRARSFAVRRLARAARQPVQEVARVDAERARAVTALLHRERLYAELADRDAVVVEIARAEQPRARRIAARDVEPEREHDERRRELPDTRERAL